MQRTNFPLGINKSVYSILFYCDRCEDTSLLFNIWHRQPGCWTGVSPVAFFKGLGRARQGWKETIHERGSTHLHTCSHDSGKPHVERWISFFYFLFAFNSFHITLSVWVTGGRTFQGLSPRFHVRLSEFDWDPLSLQERGCSQVVCCCLPVLKVLRVCRAKRERETMVGWGGVGRGGGPHGPLPARRLEDFTPFRLKNGNVTARYISPTIGIWASALFI